MKTQKKIDHKLKLKLKILVFNKINKVQFKKKIINIFLKDNKYQDLIKNHNKSKKKKMMMIMNNKTNNLNNLLK